MRQTRQSHVRRGRRDAVARNVRRHNRSWLIDFAITSTAPGGSAAHRQSVVAHGHPEAATERAAAALIKHLAATNNVDASELHARAVNITRYEGDRSCGHSH